LRHERREIGAGARSRGILADLAAKRSRATAGFSDKVSNSFFYVLNRQSPYRGGRTTAAQP
jgi:hypothetical protein